MSQSRSIVDYIALSNLQFQQQSLHTTFIHRYVILRLLSEGGQSRVWTALSPDQPNETVVLKQYELADSTKLLKFKYELYLLNKVKQSQIPHLLHLQSSCYDAIQRSGYLIYPYIDVPYDSRCLLLRISNLTLIRGMRDISRAVKGLHRLKIIHGDLKPRNILWCRHTYNPRLIDLGSAQWIVPLMDTQVGTRPYKAPELLIPSFMPGRYQRRLHRAIDIWSLGITFLCWILPSIPDIRFKSGNHIDTWSQSMVHSFFEFGGDKTQHTENHLTHPHRGPLPQLHPKYNSWLKWVQDQGLSLPQSRTSLLKLLDPLLLHMLSPDPTRRWNASQVECYLANMEQKLDQHTRRQ